MATRADVKTANKAGVSAGRRTPFNSMEINDQVGGVNGGLTDDVAGAGATVVKSRTLNEAGITRVPYTTTQSKAYSN